jgi:hypothetical protein
MCGHRLLLWACGHLAPADSAPPWCASVRLPGAPRGVPPVECPCGRALPCLCTVSSEPGTGTQAPHGSSPPKAVLFCTDDAIGLCAARGRWRSGRLPAFRGSAPCRHRGEALGGRLGLRSGDHLRQQRWRGGPGPMPPAGETVRAPGLHPTMARTGPDQRRWRGCRPRLESWDSGLHANRARHPRRGRSDLALGQTRQDLVLKVRRGGRLEQAE